MAQSSANTDAPHDDGHSQGKLSVGKSRLSRPLMPRTQRHAVSILLGVSGVCKGNDSLHFDLEEQVGPATWAIVVRQGTGSWRA